MEMQVNVSGNWNPIASEMLISQFSWKLFYFIKKVFGYINWNIAELYISAIIYLIQSNLLWLIQSKFSMSALSFQIHLKLIFTNFGGLGVRKKIYWVFRVILHFFRIDAGGGSWPLLIYEQLTADRQMLRMCA